MPNRSSQALVPLHSGDEERLGTGDHVLELRRVRLAELAIVEDLDLDLAVGELRDPLGEELGCLTLVGLRRGHVTGLEHDVGRRRSLAEPCGADRHRRRPFMKVRCRLVGMAEVEQEGLGKRPADQLKADRQAGPGEAAGHREGRQAQVVRRLGVAGEIERQPSPIREVGLDLRHRGGGDRRRRRQERVDPRQHRPLEGCESLCAVGDRFQILDRRERQPELERRPRHRGVVLRPFPEPARMNARALGEDDDVAQDLERRRVRDLDLDQHGPEVAQRRAGPAHGSPHFRVDVVVVVVGRDADPPPGDAPRERAFVVRHRRRGRARIERITTRDHGEQARAIGDRSRERAG